MRSSSAGSNLDRARATKDTFNQYSAALNKELQLYEEISATLTQQRQNEIISRYKEIKDKERNKKKSTNNTVISSPKEENINSSSKFRRSYYNKSIDNLNSTRSKTVENINKAMNNEDIYNMYIESPKFNNNTNIKNKTNNITENNQTIYNSSKSLNININTKSQNIKSNNTEIIDTYQKQIHNILHDNITVEALKRRVSVMSTQKLGNIFSNYKADHETNMNAEKDFCGNIILNKCDRSNKISAAIRSKSTSSMEALKNGNSIVKTGFVYTESIANCPEIANNKKYDLPEFLKLQLIGTKQYQEFANKHEKEYMKLCEELGYSYNNEKPSKSNHFNNDNKKKNQINKEDTLKTTKDIVNEMPKDIRDFIENVPGAINGIAGYLNINNELMEVSTNIINGINLGDVNKDDLRLDKQQIQFDLCKYNAEKEKENISNEARTSLTDQNLVTELKPRDIDLQAIVKRFGPPPNEKRALKKSITNRFFQKFRQIECIAANDNRKQKLFSVTTNLPKEPQTGSKKKSLPQKEHNLTAYLGPEVGDKEWGEDTLKQNAQEELSEAQKETLRQLNNEKFVEIDLGTLFAKSQKSDLSINADMNTSNINNSLKSQNQSLIINQQESAIETTQSTIEPAISFMSRDELGQFVKGYIVTPLHELSEKERAAKYINLFNKEDPESGRAKLLIDAYKFATSNDIDESGSQGSNTESIKALQRLQKLKSERILIEKELEKINNVEKFIAKIDQTKAKKISDILANASHLPVYLEYDKIRLLLGLDEKEKLSNKFINEIEQNMGNPNKKFYINPEDMIKKDLFKKIESMYGRGDDLLVDDAFEIAYKKLCKAMLHQIKWSENENIKKKPKPPFISYCNNEMIRKNENKPIYIYITTDENNTNNGTSKKVNEKKRSESNKKKLKKDNEFMINEQDTNNAYGDINKNSRSQSACQPSSNTNNTNDYIRFGVLEQHQKIKQRINANRARSQKTYRKYMTTQADFYNTVNSFDQFDNLYKYQNIESENKIKQSNLSNTYSANINACTGDLDSFETISLSCIPDNLDQNPVTKVIKNINAKESKPENIYIMSMAKYIPGLAGKSKNIETLELIYESIPIEERMNFISNIIAVEVGSEISNYMTDIAIELVKKGFGCNDNDILNIYKDYIIEQYKMSSYNNVDNLNTITSLNETFNTLTTPTVYENNYKEFDKYIAPNNILDYNNIQSKLQGKNNNNNNNNKANSQPISPMTKRQKLDEALANETNMEALRKNKIVNRDEIRNNPNKDEFEVAAERYLKETEPMVKMAIPNVLIPTNCTNISKYPPPNDTETGKMYAQTTRTLTQRLWSIFNEHRSSSCKLPKPSSVAHITTENIIDNNTKPNPKFDLTIPKMSNLVTRGKEEYHLLSTIIKKNNNPLLKMLHKNLDENNKNEYDKNMLLTERECLLLLRVFDELGLGLHNKKGSSETYNALLTTETDFNNEQLKKLLDAAENEPLPKPSSLRDCVNKALYSSVHDTQLYYATSKILKIHENLLDKCEKISGLEQCRKIIDPHTVSTIITGKKQDPVYQTVMERNPVFSAYSRISTLDMNEFEKIRVDIICQAITDTNKRMYNKIITENSDELGLNTPSGNSNQTEKNNNTNNLNKNSTSSLQKINNKNSINSSSSVNESNVSYINLESGMEQQPTITNITDKDNFIENMEVKKVTPYNLDVINSGDEIITDFAKIIGRSVSSSILHSKNNFSILGKKDNIGSPDIQDSKIKSSQKANRFTQEPDTPIIVAATVSRRGNKSDSRPGSSSLNSTLHIRNNDTDNKQNEKLLKDDKIPSIYISTTDKPLIGQTATQYLPTLGVSEVNPLKTVSPNDVTKILTMIENKSRPSSKSSTNRAVTPQNQNSSFKRSCPNISDQLKQNIQKINETTNEQQKYIKRSPSTANIDKQPINDLETDDFILRRSSSQPSSRSSALYNLPRSKQFKMDGLW